MGPMENLEGMVRYWQEHPEWMEMMDPASPVHKDKILERALYMDMWEPYLPERGAVLDLGGGVGRFTETLLARDCQVHLVDPDLRSLWRALAMAAGGVSQAVSCSTFIISGKPAIQSYRW